MIKFLKLTVRNFLGFGNAYTEFNLERPGTTLIIGENLDHTSEGKGSNGVGKSTIFNALTYAIYNQPISKVDKIDSLVNNINKKNMEVILEFIAEDGDHCKIHRSRKMKAGAEGNKTLWYINGEDKTRGVTETDKDIQTKIGIPYDLFVNIVVFSATAEGGFLNKKGPDQRSFMEELCGITLVTQRAEILKKRIKGTKADFELKQQQVDQLEKEHQRHKTLIENAKNRVTNWKTQTEQTINDLFAQLEQVQNVDIEAEAVHHAKVAEYSAEMRELQMKIRETQRMFAENQTQEKKLQKELNHLRDSKCPYCLQQFADAASKIDSLEQELAIVQTKVRAQMFDVEALQIDYDKCKQKHDEAKALITVADLDELIEIKNEAKNIKRKIADLDNATNPFEEPLQELLNTKLDAVDYDGLNAIKKTLDHQQFLLKLLTKSDSFVRKELISTTLPFLNKQLRSHLHDLGLPHVVEFMPDLEPKITKNGNAFEFGLLSGGQRARVNFALFVAFKDVRERLNGKTNVVAFDEVLDFGLDAVGVTACAQLLKRIARREGTSMYVISHRDEISTAFENKILVRMENGFSSIIEDV